MQSCSTMSFMQPNEGEPRSKSSKVRKFVLWFAVFAIVFVGLLGIGAFAYTGLGIHNMSAKQGHMYPVRGLLVFTRTNSVQRYSDSVGEPPEDLDSLAMVERGAAYYTSGCVQCHGAPGVKPQMWAEGIVPEPPHLAEGKLIPNRSNKELAWVVENGLKFAGMPAWPSEVRVDEAWTMVAFLRALPGMSPERYREVAYGEDEAGQRAESSEVEGAEYLGADDLHHLAECATCHGYDGSGRPSGAFPNLTILDEEYIYLSLEAYAKGLRHSGFMQPQALRLSHEQFEKLSKYYAQQPETYAADSNPSEKLLTRGEQIVLHGVPDRGIAECTSCHGIAEQTETQADQDTLLYPQLAGQYAAYTRLQLRAWVDGTRGSATEENPEVRGAHVLEPEEIEAVAAYYSTLDEPYARTETSMR